MFKFAVKEFETESPTTAPDLSVWLRPSFPLAQICTHSPYERGGYHPAISQTAAHLHIEFSLPLRSIAFTRNGRPCRDR